MILSYALKSIDINKAMSAIRSEYMWPHTLLMIYSRKFSRIYNPSDLSDVDHNAHHNRLVVYLALLRLPGTGAHTGDTQAVQGGAEEMGHWQVILPL